MDIPQEIINRIHGSAIEKHPGAICVANYKGGVGKTTITCLLGYYLAKKGKKVLMIDIDPQCSLSLAVGFDLEAVNKTQFTIYHLVTPNKWDKIAKQKFGDYIFPVPDKYAPPNLDTIRGAFDVDMLDIEIAQTLAKSEKQLYQLFLYVRQMINSFDKYDYVLIDCPPNKMYLTQAMLRASSYYITVTIPDMISVYGMPRLLRWIKQIEKEEKPKLLGCILNGVIRAGGNEWGTVNQQQAQSELYRTIKGDLDVEEREVIGTSSVLAHIPRLDVISKFLSQGDEKEAKFDFNRSASGQQDVNTIMMNLVTRIENRIDKYAQA